MCRYPPSTIHRYLPSTQRIQTHTSHHPTAPDPCPSPLPTHNIGYYDNLTNRPRTTTGLLTPHRPSSKSERNLILQVNINGLRNKLEEFKLLIHDTHADIITIQETKLTPKAKTPKIHNFTSVRTDRLHKAGGGLITLIRHHYSHYNRHDSFDTIYSFRKK